MTINAYPLQWPEGWKRTAPADRKAAKFNKAGTARVPGGWRPRADLTMADALGLQPLGVVRCIPPTGGRMLTRSTFKRPKLERAPVVHTQVPAHLRRSASFARADGGHEAGKRMAESLAEGHQ